MPPKFGMDSPQNVKHILRKAFFKHALERINTGRPSHNKNTVQGWQYDSANII